MTTANLINVSRIRFLLTNVASKKEKQVVFVKPMKNVYQRNVGRRPDFIVKENVPFLLLQSKEAIYAIMIWNAKMQSVNSKLCSLVTMVSVEEKTYQQVGVVTTTQNVRGQQLVLITV